MPDQVNDASLDRRLGEGRGDRLREALQPVHEGDQDVLKAPMALLVHHRQPELGALIVGDPEAQNLALALADVDTTLIDEVLRVMERLRKTTLNHCAQAGNLGLWNILTRKYCAQLLIIIIYGYTFRGGKMFIYIAVMGWRMLSSCHGTMGYEARPPTIGESR